MPPTRPKQRSTWRKKPPNHPTTIFGHSNHSLLPVYTLKKTPINPSVPLVALHLAGIEIFHHPACVIH